MEENTNQPQAPTSKPQKPTRPWLGLSIVSIVFGCLSLVLGLCFFIGISISLIGLILGIIAIVKKQRAVAIVGTSLNALALVLVVILRLIFLFKTGAFIDF